MNNSDVAYAFAAGATGGKGSNMFIEGDTIYSYGYHFKIAKRLGGREYLYNSDSYSSSTSQHKSHVRQAISGTIWYAPNCNPAEIPADIQSQVVELMGKIPRARSNLPYYVRELNGLIGEWKKSKERFKLESDWLDAFPEREVGIFRSFWKQEAVKAGDDEVLVVGGKSIFIHKGQTIASLEKDVLRIEGISRFKVQHLYTLGGMKDHDYMELSFMDTQWSTLGMIHQYPVELNVKTMELITPVDKKAFRKILAAAVRRLDSMNQHDQWTIKNAVHAAVRKCLHVGAITELRRVKVYAKIQSAQTAIDVAETLGG
jgi:hypothetical protein